MEIQTMRVQSPEPIEKGRHGGKCLSSQHSAAGMGGRSGSAGERALGWLAWSGWYCSKGNRRDLASYKVGGEKPCPQVHWPHMYLHVCVDMYTHKRNIFQNQNGKKV